jgi:hypothetical protein
MPINEEELAAFEQMLINDKEFWHVDMEDSDFKIELVMPRIVYDSEDLYRSTE